MSLLLTYEAAYSAGPNLAGGKGWNLGRLARYGFAVPPGVVVTAAVYRAVLADPTIAPLIAELTEVSAEAATDSLVANRLAMLRDELRSIRLPNGLAAEIAALLQANGWEEEPLAVRSSAAAEDGASASFAGIHESVLNVVGASAVLAALRETYASLWTPHALAYRRRLAIADADCACAVVICQMVRQAAGTPPSAAGVAFSCDPATGRRDVVVINAVTGWGDALVRGNVQPQQFTIQAKYGDWSIVERSQPTLPIALSDEEAQRLARLVFRVHWALGDGQDPQDIEWVYDGAQFWLVQARPVTRLPRWTFPAVAAQPVHWSNANVRDSMPEPITMYTWSAVQDMVGHILHAAPRAVQYPVPEGMECMRRFSGRPYFDLTGTQWLMYDSMGILPADLKKDLGGAQPEIEVPSQQPMSGTEGRRRGQAQRRLLFRLWNFERELWPAIQRMHERLHVARAFDLKPLSNEQLRQRVDDLYRENLEFGSLFQLANTNAAVWHGMARGLMKWLDPVNGETMLTRMLTHGGDVPSAEQGYRLQEVAEHVRNDTVAQQWLVLGDNSPDGWRQLPAASPFYQAFKCYLHDYGHRSAVEAEFANARWIDDPAYLLDQVRFLLAHPPAQDARAQAAAARQQAEQAFRRSTWLPRPVSRWLIRRAQRGFALREHAKSALLAGAEPLRRVVLEIARRLQTSGALVNADDLFHTTPYDLECYLRGEWQGEGLRALVADRIAQLAAWRTESPPDVITCPARHDAVAPQYAVEVAIATDHQWSGVAAAAGSATGRACVLRSPQEAASLQRGDVLVAPSTDPGWTPLFLRASAIVMETGGYLSHGAIVAREYGLPAVVNMPGILGQIKSGDRLLVDGNAGVVQRLSVAEADALARNTD